MKRLFTTLVLIVIALSAVAQNSILRPRVEIAELESEEDALELEVFYMNDETPRMYYLSLGHLGIGGDIVQIQFDPLFELFIPLGNTLDEAIEKMKDIQDMYKQSRLATTDITGCFAVAYPNDSRVSVKVTSRRFLATKVLEFSIPEEGLVRATHISKSNFNSILSSLKVYRKLHPKEQ